MADPLFWYYSQHTVKEKFSFFLLASSGNYSNSFSDTRNTLGLLEMKLIENGFGLRSQDGDYFETRFAKKLARLH